MPTPQRIRNPHLKVVEEVVEPKKLNQYPVPELDPVLEDDIGENNPTVHRQYRRSLQSGRKELEAAFVDPGPHIKRAVVLSSTIVLALVMRTSVTKFRPSMKSVYATILNKHALSMFKNLRTLRSDLAKEIRSLIKKGPDRYMSGAISELASIKAPN